METVMGEVDERAGGVEGVELVYLAPDAVQLEDNVRRHPNLTEEFVQSVATQGVLAPVIAHRDALGQVMVTDGQRRTLAAREVGLAVIPVLVGPDPGSVEGRVVDQLTLNEARAGLTTPEKMLAVQQLTLFGMEAESVARKTGLRASEVRDLVRVAQSKSARRVVEEVPDLTVAQASFLEDVLASPVADEDFTHRLEEELSVEPEAADHILARARHEVRFEDEFRRVEADLDARGVTHVRGSEADPRWDRWSHSWADAKGEPITEESHESCPGHVTVLVERDSEDPGIDCLVRCKDWKEFGHRWSWEVKAPRQKESKSSEPLTDEEVAERAARATERRLVIETNRASDAAAEVRREYVHSLLKSPPAGILEFQATLLTASKYSENRLPYPEELLREAGVLPQRVSVAHWASRGGHAAKQAVLAMLIAMCEAQMPRDFWRREGGVYGMPQPCVYLRQLASWGYTLSEVERTYCETVEAVLARARPEDEDEVER